MLGCSISNNCLFISHRCQSKIVSFGGQSFDTSSYRLMNATPKFYKMQLERKQRRVNSGDIASLDFLELCFVNKCTKLADNMWTSLQDPVINVQEGVSHQRKIFMSYQWKTAARILLNTDKSSMQFCKKKCRKWREIPSHTVKVKITIDRESYSMWSVSLKLLGTFLLRMLIGVRLQSIWKKTVRILQC